MARRYYDRRGYDYHRHTALRRIVDILFGTWLTLVVQLALQG